MSNVKKGRTYIVLCYSRWEKDCNAYWVSVILAIQRRQYEQVKVAVPVVLNVLKAITSESDDEQENIEDLFSRAICIANSIQAVSSKLVSDRENLSIFYEVILVFLLDPYSCSSFFTLQSRMPDWGKNSTRCWASLSWKSWSTLLYSKLEILFLLFLPYI